MERRVPHSSLEGACLRLIYLIWGRNTERGGRHCETWRKRTARKIRARFPTLKGMVPERF